MGLRGPIPKRSDRKLGHRTQAELAQIEKHVYSRCAVEDCNRIAGHARYDPNGRYCAKHRDHETD